VIAGTNPADMAVAANHLAAIGGGKVAVENGEVVASVASLYSASMPRSR
jgi:adenine deaminase